MAHYIPPKKTSSGRTVRLTRKYRESLAETTSQVFCDVNAELSQLSEQLDAAVSRTEEPGLVKSVFAQWQDLFTELLTADVEHQRYLEEQESTEHGARMAELLAYYTGLRFKIKDYLPQFTR